MGAKIAAFEFRYQLRNPVFWVAFAAFFMVTFGLVTSGQIQAGLGSGIHTNSSIVIARLTGTTSIFAIFLLVAFIATAIVRDDETGFGPILRSTGVAKRDYVFGRFFGALLISVVAYCGAPLGMLFGAMMPWLDPETLGLSSISSGLPGVRVDRLEVQLARDQEDDGLDGGQTREAARAALGGLEQAVDGFEEAVGLTGLRPGNDAFQMAAHETGDFLHRLDLGSHDADAPVQ
jgi:hypothetical protein